MKSFPFIILMAFSALTSCTKYIDVVPDNRVIMDSDDKAAKLLVTAYPRCSVLLLRRKYERQCERQNSNQKSGWSS